VVESHRGYPQELQGKNLHMVNGEQTPENLAQDLRMQGGLLQREHDQIHQLKLKHWQSQIQP
jgi:hypothetical protein